MIMTREVDGIEWRLQLRSRRSGGLLSGLRLGKQRVAVAGGRRGWLIMHPAPVISDL